MNKYKRNENGFIVDINGDEFEFENVQEIIDKNMELEVISMCDFTVIVNPNGTLSLDDQQGANLNNIEDEEFEDIEDILNRLEGSYLYDYSFVPRY